MTRHMNFLFSSKGSLYQGHRAKLQEKILEIKLKFDFILNNFDIRQSGTCEQRCQAENIQQEPVTALSKLNIFN